MNRTAPRGFTLIELLVVIAILGILASIILVSVGNARSRGADASLKGSLTAVRTQAELYASDSGSAGYGTQASTAVAAGSACGAAGMWTNTTVAAATEAASDQAGAATLAGVSNAAVVCRSSASFYIVAGVLRSDPTKVFCVDSNGIAKESTASAFASAANVTALTGCPN